MKRLVLILFFGVAQGMVFGANAPTQVVSTHIQRTPMEKLALRLRQHNLQIERNVKTGKLTKDQAKALKAQVETIRKAEIADLKSNGTKTLTDTQEAQLTEHEWGQSSIINF